MIEQATRFSTLRFAVAVALAALAGLLAINVVTAQAQQPGTPAFCQQYPNHPSCEEGVVEPPDDDDDVDDDARGPAAAGPPGAGPSATGPSAAGAGTGELPFTGYPVTPLLLILLVLLLGGLTLRGFVAVRDRLAGRHAGRGAGA